MFHFALTLGTGLMVPYLDIIAATLQTQTAHLTSVGRSHVGNDATHHNVLDGMAVRTRHRSNLLTKEPAPLVHLGFVATLLTAIFQFPSHNKICVSVCKGTKKIGIIICMNEKKIVLLYR